MPLPRLLKSALGVLPADYYSTLRDLYRARRDTIKLYLAAWHDVRTFRRHSGLMSGNRQRVLQARIIKSYHRIEKGLALRSPRPGFGTDAIAELIEDVTRYTAKFGVDRTVERAIGCLREYAAFNTRAGTTSPIVARFLDAAPGNLKPESLMEGGTRQIHRSAILAATHVSFDAFVRTRHSIRQFSEVPVDVALIRQAAELAQFAPSVCNREAGRIYMVENRSRIAELLQFQNGNRGFGEQCDKLLVVATSLDCFLTVGERYQCWIDGGLFAMALIYALHSQGLGTCCLNWSVEPETDSLFKRAAGIDTSQAIIMLIAVGHIPETLKVATSSRRPLDEVLSSI